MEKGDFAMIRVRLALLVLTAVLILGACASDSPYSGSPEPSQRGRSSHGH